MLYVRSVLHSKQYFRCIQVQYGKLHVCLFLSPFHTALFSFQRHSVSATLAASVLTVDTSFSPFIQTKGHVCGDTDASAFADACWLQRGESFTHQIPVHESP